MSDNDTLLGYTKAPPAWGDPFEGKSMAEVVAFCRANGIKKLNYRGVELEFDGPGPAAAPVAADLQKFAETLAGGVPDDVELLGWSAGGDFKGDMKLIQDALAAALE